MTLGVEIALATLLVVLLIWRVHERMHKRFDRLDRDHEQMHAELGEQRRLALTERDNQWHAFETLRGHLMRIIDALVAPWKTQPPGPKSPEDDTQ